MKMFRINYTGDGKKYTILMFAKDKKQAVKKCRDVFKEMGFDEAKIDSINAIS